MLPMATNGRTIVGIDPRPTPYDGHEFRSRTEARWAVFFNTLGIPYHYEKDIYPLGAGLGGYLPDFWLPEQRCWFEVKGEHPNQREMQRGEALGKKLDQTVYIFHGPVKLPVTALEIMWDEPEKYLAPSHEGLAARDAYMAARKSGDPDAERDAFEELLDAMTTDLTRNPSPKSRGSIGMRIHTPGGHGSSSLIYVWVECPVCGYCDIVSSNGGKASCGCLEAIDNVFWERAQRSGLSRQELYGTKYGQHTRCFTVFNSEGLHKPHRSNRLHEAYGAARAERFEQGNKGGGR